MRIGIELAQLQSPLQTGLYWYARRLVQGMSDMDTRHSIRLFLSKASAMEVASIKALFPRLSVSSYQAPGFPRRLRTRLCAVNRVDIFQYITNIAIPVSRYRKNAFLIPDLTTILFPEWHRSGNRRHWDSILEKVISHGDLIVTFSEHTRQEICSRLGIAGEMIRAIPLAAGDEFRPLPASSVLPHLQGLGLGYGKYILSAGAIEPRKNHLALVRAFAKLRQNTDFHEYSLVLAGPQGWLYDDLLSEVGTLGLNDHVRFLGHVESLVPLYCGAAVMVYPSFYEGFGLPPLEAMACGTPVITSNTSSLPEVVGTAAITLDPHDRNGLTDALIQVLSVPARRETMRLAGLARAAQFSWRRTAAETLAAYEWLCGK